jgi:hypothetical protein
MIATPIVLTAQKRRQIREREYENREGLGLEYWRSWRRCTPPRHSSRR